MGRVGIGMEKANGDAGVVFGDQLCCQVSHCLFVRGFYHPAIRIHAFSKCIAMVAGNQWGRQGDIEIILFKPAFGSHLYDIAKTFGGDEGGFRPAPFYQGIGCQCCAMNDKRDRFGVDVIFTTDQADPLYDGFLWGVMACQNLGGEQRREALILPAGEDNIGKSAADIHP